MRFGKDMPIMHISAYISICGYPHIYQYADYALIENICAYAENRNSFILSLFFICFSLLEKKERILCKKFLVFDNTGFTAALWGLSLTCALMTTEFGQLMALLRIYCHNLISR